HVAFHHLILGFCQFIIPVNVVVIAVISGIAPLFFDLPVILKGCLFDVPAFVGIGRGDVVVVLIAEVALGVTLVVAVVGLGAVQRLALTDVRPLIFVNVIG